MNTIFAIGCCSMCFHMGFLTKFIDPYSLTNNVQLSQLVWFVYVPEPSSA